MDTTIGVIMGDHAGVLLMVISVLMKCLTCCLYRSNNVNILRCGHDHPYYNNTQ